MTFARFEELVREKHPNAKLFKHGEFAGNKINVAVCFDFVEGSDFNRVYRYNGTYCDVLNRLGVKAIYKHDYDLLVYNLENAKKRNGTKHIFSGGIIDCSREIAEYTDRLKAVNENYIIV